MTGYTRQQEVTHEIGHDGRFSLRVTNPDVEISGTDEPVARVRVEIEVKAGSDAAADEVFERARFTVTQGDGYLELTEPRRNDFGLEALGRLLSGGAGRATTERVVVQVPRTARLAYDGVSAELTANRLAGEQSYRTVSGDMVLDRASGTIRIHGVSGDVSLRADDAVALDANTVSGDLSVVAPRYDAVRVVTVSGDVELEGALDADGDHRIQTVSGDLSLGVDGGITLEVRGLSTDVDVSLPHRSEGSRDRRRYVVGDGGANVQFSSMSGDVSVRGARRAAPQRTDAPRSEADGGQLAVLRALERGEIDVEEAARRLTATATDA